MNILLFIGILVLTSYLVGRLFSRFGIPKIIGYILTGIFFSPHTFQLVEINILDSFGPLLEVCLCFIIFEVGGELKWKKIKAHEKEIVNITLLAGLLPFALIIAVFWGLTILFPGFMNLSDGQNTALVFALLLGALASPTDPTATFAVIHEYDCKGKVTDTILGIAALDDAIGILLFSLSIAGAAFLLGNVSSPGQSLLNALLHIFGGMAVGVAFALLMDFLIKWLDVHPDGQLIVIVFSILTLCYGLCTFLKFDELLACMTMGVVIANRSPYEKNILSILKRYTEELIFLLFFVLSGLHLNIQAMQLAIIPIIIYIIFRTIGKYLGSHLGAHLAHADKAIKKYTAGGLIAQGGVVIGLALVISQNPAFDKIADLLLAVVMGAAVVHELIGPLLAKWSLDKAGELKKL